MYTLFWRNFMSNFKLNGSECLGIEFGSTRIKAILIDDEFNVLATGSYDWENKLVDGYWTYSIDDIWHGLQSAYKSLNDECENKFSSKITSLSAIGFSAMMHGYLAFDKDDNLLVPFRTWRNTTTVQAARELTRVFNFNIPQRWSIAHLYQAILNNEEHVKDISYITTLAGYVHYKLTGKKALGIGDASGMFPIDSDINDYNQEMLEKFSNLETVKQFDWNIKDILPKVLLAGENAGTLSEDGAKLLDPSATLKAGALMCPAEGDAGTGMVATNSVAQRTGNISAGTRRAMGSVKFEKQLIKQMKRTGTLAMCRLDNNTVLEKGLYYYQGNDFASELVYSVGRLCEPCLEHIDNNFKPLDTIQKGEFADVTEDIVYLLQVCRHKLENNNYNNFEEDIHKANDLNGQLAHLKREELQRIQSQSGSIKVSMVYLTMIQEAQNIVTYSINLMKVSRKFQAEE